MKGTGSPLITAIRGPVMLMALGGLFAIDHLDHMEFVRSWPVLIILFGLMKLLERLFVPRPESAQP